MQPSIKTKNLLLRPFQLSDASRVQELAGDTRIAEMTEHIPHPYDDGLAEQWIATLGPAWESKRAATYAICLESQSEVVGCCGLQIDNKNKRGTLGYWIGVDYWSQGHCTEAARAVVKFGFEHLALHRIQATHLTKNPASGVVMRHVGMHHEATMTEYVLKNDQFEDVELYAIIA